METARLDPDPVLSTTEVGELFGVHPSTVKRWCDRGRLRFSRTDGGHRRIRLSEALQRARDEEIPLPLRAFGGEAGSVWEASRAAVEDGDYRRARALARAWLDAWRVEAIGELFVHLGRHTEANLSRLFDDGIRLVLRDVGERWAEGTLGVGQEHLLSETVTNALHRLRRVRVRWRHLDEGHLENQESRPVALVGCAQGERHALGARCVQVALEREGWFVHFLGSDLPLDEWPVLQARTGASLLCVSFSSLRSRAEVLRCIRSLSERYDRSRPYRLALGGAGEGLDEVGRTEPFQDVASFRTVGDLLPWLAANGNGRD